MLGVPPKSSSGTSNLCVMSRLTKCATPGLFQTGIEACRARSPRLTSAPHRCEVKSPQDIFTERINNAITSGQSGVIETGYGNDYRQARCIERAAQKAAPQFDAANPAHSVPNILMVVNHDAHADVEDFVQALTGAFQGHLVGTGIQNTILEIDLYVWIGQKDGGSEPAARIIYNHRSPIKETVRALLQL